MYRGAITQGTEPNWGPLMGAVGERLIGDFMWMFEVELSSGTRLQAYKHIDTRCYAHLANGAAAFAFERPDRYRRVEVADLFAAVFSALPGLAGVTDEQIVASRAAVERLRSG